MSDTVPESPHRDRVIEAMNDGLRGLSLPDRTVALRQLLNAHLRNVPTDSLNDLQRVITREQQRRDIEPPRLPHQPSVPTETPQQIAERWQREIVAGVRETQLEVFQGKSYRSLRSGQSFDTESFIKIAAQRPTDLVDVTQYLHLTREDAVTNALEDRFDIPRQSNTNEPRSNKTLLVVTRRNPDESIELQGGGNIRRDKTGEITPAIFKFTFQQPKAFEQFLRWLQADPTTALNAVLRGTLTSPEAQDYLTSKVRTAFTTEVDDLRIEHPNRERTHFVRNTGTNRFEPSIPR